VKFVEVEKIKNVAKEYYFRKLLGIILMSLMKLRLNELNLSWFLGSRRSKLEV
jgi:hypothetical protein